MATFTAGALFGFDVCHDLICLLVNNRRFVVQSRSNYDAEFNNAVIVLHNDRIDSHQDVAMSQTQQVSNLALAFVI